MAEEATVDEAPRPWVTRWGAVSFLVAGVTIILDQLSKFWVLYGLRLPERQTVEVLPFFHLTMVWNQGISFGLLRADTDLKRILLTAAALAIVAALVAWARRMSRPVLAFAVGLMLGGALGNNLIDRIRIGQVVDFLDFHPLFPWVFNVADSAINVGVALLLLDMYLESKKPSAT
jgi:signal peptidase II